MGRSSPRPTPPRPRWRLAAGPAVLAALAWLALLPATALAHPLGNFTINHYAGLTIGRTSIVVDLVIDMAEIPTFQERQGMDADGDGSVSDEESAAWAGTACQTLATTIRLDRDGQPQTAATSSHLVSFLGGAGGLSTLRLECRLSASLVPPLDAPATFTFSDPSYAERIGWREVVVTADGTVLDAHGLPSVSASQKLTSYPASMLAQPLDLRTATIGARPAAEAGSSSGPAAKPAPVEPAPMAAAPNGAVPGGVAAELPDIFRTTDLTPVVLLLSLGTAVALGAGHALTPGHGKTLMAAYLVGSRGTSVHAVGLGLSVAVSHTLGIVVLALLIVGAQGLLPPDVEVRAAPVVAAISIVAIGGWMLVAEVRRRLAARRSAGRHHDGHDEHPHEHSHEHMAGDAEGEHSHGGIPHRHLPPSATALSWRGLFVLGLAGGLIPSTSALLILLGSIAAGRPAFGLVLVVAFGLGMAAVMTGVGLAMTVARTRLDGMPRRSGLGRLAAGAPLLASVAVLGLGLVLTWSAVAGTPVL
jgi:ABC-type nickel/cobalt efflux system permease component RcnA